MTRPDDLRTACERCDREGCRYLELERTYNCFAAGDVERYAFSVAQRECVPIDWRAEALELRHQIAVINAADDENGEAAEVAEAWRAKVEPLIEQLRVARVTWRTAPHQSQALLIAVVAAVDALLDATTMAGEIEPGQCHAARGGS